MKLIIPLLVIIIIAFLIGPLDVDVGPPASTLELTMSNNINNDINNLGIDPAAYQYADLITVPDNIKTNGTLDFNLKNLDPMNTSGLTENNAMVITGIDQPTGYCKLNPSGTDIEDIDLTDLIMNDRPENDRPEYATNWRTAEANYPLKYPMMDNSSNWNKYFS